MNAIAVKCMYERSCNVCKQAFEIRSPYKLICSNPCRVISAKLSRSKYKKTAMGIGKRRAWQKSARGLACKRRHLNTPKCKKTNASRIRRLVQSTSYYRIQHNLRTSKAYRDLRSNLITKFGMCASCHQENDLTIDHIVPMSLGGKHEIENLQVLCRSCNSKKKQEIIIYELPQMQQTIN